MLQAAAAGPLPNNLQKASPPAEPAPAPAKVPA
jgi:hypothetical protein